MKKYILVIIILFSSFNLYAGYNRPEGKFQFIVMADSRASHKGTNEEVLVKLVKHAQKTNAKFLVFPGDMVKGSTDPNITREELVNWEKLMLNNFDRSIYPIIGNHEVYSLGSQEAYRKLFSSYVPDNGPEDEKSLTYYFDYGNSRFIAIDTEYFGDLGRVRHLDWLEKALKDARTKEIEHIFVFGHDPAFPTSYHTKSSLPNASAYLHNKKPAIDSIAERDKFWALLKKYNVIAYFCGHEHLYTRQKVDGLWQIIAGSAGAPLASPNIGYPGPNATERDREEFKNKKPLYEILGYPHGPGEIPQAGTDFVTKKNYHYLLVEVDNKNVSVTTFGIEKTDETNQDYKKITIIDKFELTPQEFTNSAGMKMIQLDAKPFMTGTMYNQSNQHWYEFMWEEPRYVNNLKPFYLSQYEVTNLQYRQFLRETNRPAPKGLLLQKMEMIKDFEPLKSPDFNGDNQPIVCVTVADAEGFCEWLSKKEGKSYRLPSNNEWEYACRADTSTSYNWGSEEASIEMANYDPFLVEDSFDGKIAMFSIQQAAKLRGGKVKWNADKKQISGCIQGKDFQVTVGQSQAVVNGKTITMEAMAVLQGNEVMVPVKFLAFDLALIFTGAPMPVGSFKPNAWGLYDMHGNVNEITSSSHAKGFRKVRGGAWNDSARRCRSASVRERWQIHAGMAGVGFRVICDVPPPNQLEVKVGDPIILKTLEGREGFWSPKLLLLRDNTLIVRDRMSKDFGKTWSDCPLQPNQNVIELSDKTIISIPDFMGRDKSTPPGFGKATGLRSTDGWKTTESFEVTFYSPYATGGFNDLGDYKDYIGTVDHDILEMPDGTLLMSVYGFFSNKRTLSDYQRYPIETQQWRYAGWVAKSKDKGKTWKYLSTAVYHPNMTRAGGCEIGMVSLANGDLLLGARPGEEGYPNEKILFVSSEDNGKTWNNARYCYADGIAVTGVYPQFVLMKNGILAMSWERTGRYTSSIAFSLDGRGENWSHRTKLPVAKNGYNDIVEIKPGELLVLGAGKTDGKYDVRIIPVSVRKKPATN